MLRQFCCLFLSAVVSARSAVCPVLTSGCTAVTDKCVEQSFTLSIWWRLSIKKQFLVFPHQIKRQFLFFFGPNTQPIRRGQTSLSMNRCFTKQKPSDTLIELISINWCKQLTDRSIGFEPPINCLLPIASDLCLCVHFWSVVTIVWVTACLRRSLNVWVVWMKTRSQKEEMNGNDKRKPYKYKWNQFFK